MWRIRGWRVRNIAAAIFLLVCFGTGFYLAQLYGEISELIEQRRAALTSAIYSAPTVIRRDDDIERIHLTGRLSHLSYTQAAAAAAPGEYTLTPAAMAIYVRAFRIGVRDYPAQLVRINLDDERVTGIADSFGVRKEDAVLEPEVIGRLLPGAPAERAEVQLADLKPYLVKGLLATEDRFFYWHPGIDPVRIAEAAIADVRARRLKEGASTITQQLARTFLDRRDRSFGRKFRELAVALVIELRLSKNEILERYINDVAMGSYEGTPIEGLPQASRYLFNKDLREVTPAEAATLIGMIRAPTLYDPRRHPDACRDRRNTVLGVMLRAGLIDRAAYDSTVASPVAIAKAPGLRRAPHFTDYVTSFVAKIPGLGGHLEGLKVYSTLDPEMQASAASAVTENLERLEKQHRALRRAEKKDQLESSMVVLDVESGAIRAMVGGRDYSESQFNRAVAAERQPGSAFKPIVYLTALDPERAPFSPPLTLASVLPDRPMSFGGWMPVNYEREYHGQVTLVDALSESLNVPTAWVGSRLGAPSIVRTAHELGIGEDLPAVLPISIGADETTLLELTGAYQVFASGGIESSPYAVESVVDAKGHLIYHHEDDERRVIRPAVAYLVTGALKAVLRYGTGAGATRMGLDFPAAGKTGTTQDYHDAYFIGYTPDIVCGVWVGFDEPQSIGLPGASAALPAWVRFMTDTVSADSGDFPEPSGITIATIDPESGGLATPQCPRSMALPFLVGSEPRVLCPLHSGALIASAPAGGTAAASPPPAAPAMPPPAAPPQANAIAGPPSGSVFGGITKFFSSLFH
ncbi:MAG TPA: transglycosylase domain-containing protein [Candidatus Binataceae bacterium]|nr:transglycosylase domain-containing protein [Candidatus Binataceae bacterium]